jgi:hypothetical protein
MRITNLGGISKTQRYLYHFATMGGAYARPHASCVRVVRLTLRFIVERKGIPTFGAR